MTIDKDAWQRVLISPETPIISAIDKIDREALRILLVVNMEQKLLGVVTDGDIRRHILRHGNLEIPVDHIMNRAPHVVSDVESREQILRKMQQLNVLHLPVVDFAGRIVGLELLSHVAEKKKYDNWVVFMAGGLGTRLHPLTLEYPKPLVRIGNKPILEILLENFINNGFHQFYFSVNYKASMIEEYFGNGEKWGVAIHYLHEDIALGTIGSLQILPEKPTEPFFVVNADIMTNLNFAQMLEFHHTHRTQPLATICVRQYQNTIPYGVLTIDSGNHQLLNIEEKPTYHYFVNAGVYMLNPDILSYFPKKNARYDMPSLLLSLLKEKKFITTFPIREYWLDVGSHDSLSQATSDYEKVFIE